jgi:FkbH-like protein
VRARLPEVTSMQVPADPELIPDMLLTHRQLFDRLNITSEDRRRVDMVRMDQERQRLAEQLTSEDFLTSAQLKVDIHRPREDEVARVAQLINKSNQFNVTTRRYAADQVKEFIADEDAEVFCVTVSDRFGDYGLVGVCILRFTKSAAEFDSLLMSCRVLGRGIETTMIATGVELARSRGLTEIRGEYVPTAKNQMVSELFQKHGFTASGAAGHFVRDTSEIVIPAYLYVSGLGVRAPA